VLFIKGFDWMIVESTRQCMVKVLYIKGFDWMICEKHGTVYGQGVVYMYTIP
jgi:hypothetical protein